MNWISDLAKVYDDNESIAGKAETVSVGKEKRRPLL